MPNMILTSLGVVEDFFSIQLLHTANRQVDCYNCIRRLQINKLHLNKPKGFRERGQEGREPFLRLWPL